ncbi:MAG: esterase-like activity of phytase family protein [Sphingobacteriia bacterium]
MKKTIYLLLGVLLVLSCKPTQKSASNERIIDKISSLKVLDIFEVPHNLQYKETTVGGLSGIDYNKEADEYYIICDDRSNINPARFYTAKIKLKDTKIDSVIWKDVQYLKQPNGNVYPDYYKDAKNACDPESIRFNPINKNFIWTSEGERKLVDKDTVLVNPSINIMDKSGKWIDTFPLPSNLWMSANARGPRTNGVFEGMSFGEFYKKLFVIVEEPLQEDGPRVETFPQNTWLRFFRFDVDTKQNTEQYAYKPEVIDFPANPLNAFKVNGISEILSIGNFRFIVIERAYSTGRQKCTIKLFLADARGATNVKDITSLALDNSFVPMSKKLLLNFDDMPDFIDNVEGITLGPILPNGHQSIILVVDNNFSEFEKTQIFLLEIIP